MISLSAVTEEYRNLLSKEGYQNPTSYVNNATIKEYLSELFPNDIEIVTLPIKQRGSVVINKKRFGPLNALDILFAQQRSAEACNIKILQVTT